MAIMAEMGVNTIRGAHYQHAQEWYDDADKAGMIMWAEVPFVHQSSFTNGAPKPALIDNGKEQLTELIRQNYNHPSIVVWSIGNETDIRPVQLNLKVPAHKTGTAEVSEDPNTPSVESSRNSHLAMLHGAPTQQDIPFTTRVLPASRSTEDTVAAGNGLDPKDPMKPPYRRYDPDAAPVARQGPLAQRRGGLAASTADNCAGIHA